MSELVGQQNLYGTSSIYEATFGGVSTAALALGVSPSVEKALPHAVAQTVYVSSGQHDDRTIPDFLRPDFLRPEGSGRDPERLSSA